MMDAHAQMNACVSVCGSCPSVIQYNIYSGSSGSTNVDTGTDFSPPDHTSGYISPIVRLFFASICFFFCFDITIKGNNHKRKGNKTTKTTMDSNIRHRDTERSKIIHTLNEAIRNNRMVSVYTDDFIFQGRCISTGLQWVQTDRSKRWGTSQYVVEMDKVISIPTTQNTGKPTLRYNRAHVVVPDIVRIEWVPTTPNDFNPDEWYDAKEFNRYTANRQRILTRDDCAFLHWIGITALPLRVSEYLAIAAYVVLNRDAFPIMADIIVNKILYSCIETSYKHNRFQRRIHRSAFLRNLLPYIKDPDFKVYKDGKYNRTVSTRRRRRIKENKRRPVGSGYRMGTATTSILSHLRNGH